MSEYKLSIARDKTEKKQYLPVPIEVMKRHERIEDLVYEHHTSPLLFCGGSWIVNQVYY